VEVVRKGIVGWWVLLLRPVSGSDGAGYPNGALVRGLRNRAAFSLGTQRDVITVVIVVAVVVVEMAWAGVGEVVVNR